VNNGAQIVHLCAGDRLQGRGEISASPETGPRSSSSGSPYVSQFVSVALVHLRTTNPIVILSFHVSQGCDLRRPVVDSVADGTLAA
jgi:hypothetical protein